MGRPSLIGVVTVTYNSAAVIDGFMYSLLNQRHQDFIVYVVDNVSSDDTLGRLAKYIDPRVVILGNSANLGVAEGNNIGIRAAIGDGCESVLLINNDTEFGPGLISELDKGLKTNTSDMVVPKIFYFDEPDRIWSAGGYFARFRGSAGHFGEDQKDEGQFEQSRPVQYAPTCCMLIRREVFDRVGLMDTNYFVYFDDVDFCHRAFRAGAKLFYLSSAHLFHKVASLTGMESDFTIRYSVRNRVYFALKNLPQWHVMFLLPLLQIHVIAKFMVIRRKTRTFWLAEKAFWEGFCLFYSTPAQNRREVLPSA